MKQMLLSRHTSTEVPKHLVDVFRFAFVLDIKPNWLSFALPQPIGAVPRSIIYPVTFHEVYFALSRAEVPQQTREADCSIRGQALSPMRLPSKSSCDGATLELRIINLVAQENEAAN
jgi:hypothetical protein